MTSVKEGIIPFFHLSSKIIANLMNFSFEHQLVTSVKRRKRTYHSSPRVKFNRPKKKIQGVIESYTDILTTSYWLHVELRKNI
jgi:hypothetical protein